MREFRRVVALLVVTAVMTSPALAKKTPVPVLVFFPHINVIGGLAGVGVNVAVVAKVNLKNGKAKLAASANVVNLTGRNVKFKNLSGVNFALPASARCDYSVSRFGAASLKGKI